MFINYYGTPRRAHSVSANGLAAPLPFMGRIRLESSPSSPFDLLILNNEHAIFSR